MKKYFVLIVSLAFVLLFGNSVSAATTEKTDLFLSTSTGPLAVYGTSSDDTEFWNLMIVDSAIVQPAPFGQVYTLVETGDSTRGYCEGANSCKSKVIYYYGFDATEDYMGESKHEYHNNFRHITKHSNDISI